MRFGADLAPKFLPKVVQGGAEGFQVWILDSVDRLRFGVPVFWGPRVQIVPGFEEIFADKLFKSFFRGILSKRAEISQNFRWVELQPHIHEEF